jgi:aminopeptidase N
MPSLTRDEAVHRADLLCVDSNIVDLDVTRGGDSAKFGSVTTIRFSCREPGAATFVELKCVELTDVTCNGRQLDSAELIGNRLRLTDLEADNVLVVKATMAYSNTGEGLVDATAEGFWSAHHTDITQPYVTRYFADAPAMAARRTQAVSIPVAEAGYPRFAVEPATAVLADELIARTDVSPGLRRAVVDYTDDLRRALIGRTLERS